MTEDKAWADCPHCGKPVTIIFQKPPQPKKPPKPAKKAGQSKLDVLTEALEHYEGELLLTDEESFYKVKPRRKLGEDRFRDIHKLLLDEFGGRYVAWDPVAHTGAFWEVPKDD